MVEKEIDGEKVEIDDNVVELIDAINSLEGVMTVSSCGGHEDPERGYSEGTYYVAFTATSLDEKAFRSLRVITWALKQCLPEVTKMSLMMGSEEFEIWKNKMAPFQGLSEAESEKRLLDRGFEDQLRFFIEGRHDDVNVNEFTKMVIMANKTAD